MIALLIRYWYIIAIAALLAALGGQHWYYKNEVASLENEKTALTLSIKAANLKEETLKNEAKNLTEKYKQSLANQFAMQAEQGRQAAARIAKDEETKRIALSSNVVELFNSSKPAAENPPVTTTLRINAGGASPDKAAVTLNQLLTVSEENDENHLKCIAQVHEWQHFWHDTEQAVEELEHAP